MGWLDPRFLFVAQHKPCRGGPRRVLRSSRSLRKNLNNSSDILQSKESGNNGYIYIYMYTVMEHFGIAPRGDKPP